MSVLNLVLKGNTLVILERRVACELSQISDEDRNEFSMLPMGDVYKGQAEPSGYIYAEDADSMSTIMDWLDGKSYVHGEVEDITPPSGIVDWLQNTANTGQPGTTSKSDIYDKLHVVYPDQDCVDARW